MWKAARYWNQGKKGESGQTVDVVICVTSNQCKSLVDIFYIIFDYIVFAGVNT